jgi:signal transduction protein with GAF and PtsI domain
METQPEFSTLSRIVEMINSDLEMPTVLNEALEVIFVSTQADVCRLYLSEDSREGLRLRASRPVQPDQLGIVVVKTVAAPDGHSSNGSSPIIIESGASHDARFRMFQHLPEERCEAILSVPVLTRERLLGVIHVQHRESHSYPRATVMLVEMIAQLVGGALLGVQLQEMERRRQRELETLTQVTQAVVSSRYLDEILQLIVTVTAELMGSKICALMLLDEEKKELVIKSTQALSPAYRDKPPIKVGQSISGQAVLQRRPIAVKDVARDSRYMYPELARQEHLKSLLSVPMIVQDRTIGVINCYTSKEHRFTKEEIQVLSAIASQAATAIERTRLIEETVTAREALQARKAIEQAKGVLMSENGLSEQQAFRMLQQQSMEKRKSMREVAEAILLVRELKKG